MGDMVASTETRTHASSGDFASEAALVDAFVSKLKRGRTPFGKLDLVTEWDYRSGSVDVLARDRKCTLVAFEAKLTNWRRAFQQAFRNTAYANRVYVLLPSKVSHRAMKDAAEFAFRGIGLCSFDGRTVDVLLEAQDHDPLLRWIRERAHAHFDGLHAHTTRRSGQSRRSILSSAQL